MLFFKSPYPFIGLLRLSGVGFSFFAVVAWNVAAQISPSPPIFLNRTGTADGSAQDRTPHLTGDGAGNWVAVWSSNFNLNGAKGTDYDIFVARSADDGATWTAPTLLNSNATFDVSGDHIPEITTDGAGNWLASWQSYFNGRDEYGEIVHLLTPRSTDMGATWSNAKSVDAESGTGQIATDSAGNWVAVYSRDNNPGNYLDSFVSRSTDFGVSWTRGVRINNTGTNRPYSSDVSQRVSTDGRGNWVAMWSSNNLLSAPGIDKDIFMARSTNAGTTWTNSALVNSTGTSDGNSVDADPDLSNDGEGNWVAVWTSGFNLNGTAGIDNDIFVARSADAGATWTSPALLHNTGTIDTNKPDGSPKIANDGMGNWVAVWTSAWHHNLTNGTDFDIMMTHSEDAGATWADPVMLNTTGVNDTSNEIGPQIAKAGGDKWIAIWTSPFDLAGTGESDQNIMITSFDIDVSPQATTITPFSPGPTNIDSLAFTVTFDQHVENFNDENDLTISHAGTASTNATISGDGDTYTVTIHGISGDGPLTLAVNAASDVQDLTGNALLSSVISSPVVIDNTAPTLSISAPSLTATNDGPVSYTVTYVGASGITLDEADITINSIGTASAGSVTVSGGGINTRTVTLSNITGDGTLGINVQPDTATDLAGNSAEDAGPSESFLVTSVPTGEAQ